MKFHFEKLSTDEKLSVNTLTLMDEVKPIVMEKWKLEYRAMSKLSFSGIFGLQDSNAKIDIQAIFFRIAFSLLQVDKCCLSSCSKNSGSYGQTLRKPRCIC